MYERHIIFSLVEREYLAGKCSVVTTVSPTYERIEWYDGRIHYVVSDYNAFAAAKPDKHINRADVH